MLTRTEKIVWFFFAGTACQLAFQQPSIILLPGERTNLFSGLSCLLALVVVLIFSRRDAIRFRSPEVLVSAALLLIAAISGLSSLTPMSSCLRLAVLLASGLGGFWCARLLLNTPKNQQRFLWLCLFLLTVVLVLSLVGYLRGGVIHHFFTKGSNHPLTNLIFLLSFGPLTLLGQKSRPLKVLGVILLGLSYIVLCLSERLSVVFIPVILGALGMLFGAFRWKHLVAGLLVIALIIGLLSQQILWFKLSKEYPYYRVENLFFSWSIAKQHPVLGIGLRTPRDQFLKDYQLKYPYSTKEQFATDVANIVTADNQILTLLAGVGFPFTILYALAVLALLVKLIRAAFRPPPDFYFPPLALLFPLGLALVHWQLYDGLLFPQNSWFFHIFLGLIPMGAATLAVKGAGADPPAVAPASEVSNRGGDIHSAAALPSSSSRVHPLTALALLLALPLLVFWRSGFFYIIDDWTALIQMTEYPFFKYLVVPDGEQWFPFFRLVYYGLVRVAREHYSLLVLVNCLGTGANAFLVYLFFRRHQGSGLALTLSALYAVAAVHHAIAWNAFYVGYLMSLGFFLGALLLTADYLQAGGRWRLGAIGLFALLSVLSHNYPLVGLLALPLYALLVAGDSGRKFWALAGTVLTVYLVFTLGYVTFAGGHAAASHNVNVFANLPAPSYLVHLSYGAFLSPFFYLFWGHYHFPVWAYVAGATLLAACLAAICCWGGKPERRLALWALLANALPFLLVSLTRYQRSLNQAFVARYGIFTLVGALLLIGLAWRLLAARRSFQGRWRLLPLGFLALLAAGQFLALPRWTEKYQEMSRAAKSCYYVLSRETETARLPQEDYQKFCPGAHPVITPSQALAVRRFLSGRGSQDF